jgi:hypothetical protein
MRNLGCLVHEMVERHEASMKALGGLILLIAFSWFIGCKSPIERRNEAAHLDSLRRDSTRPRVNAYKFGQGTEMYNQERENLGNLDSLVTPQQPPLPTP